MIQWFQRFIGRRKKTENLKEDWSEWKSIGRLFRHKNANVMVYEADTFLYLFELEVKEKKRGQGIGTAIMKRLIWYAKRVGKDVVLEASDALGTDLETVYRFYEKFGFQKGKLERVPYRHNMFFASNSH